MITRKYSVVLLFGLVGCSSAEQAAYDGDLECFRLSSEHIAVEVIAESMGNRSGTSLSKEVSEQLAKNLLVKGGAIGKDRNEIAGDMMRSAKLGQEDFIDASKSFKDDAEAKAYMVRNYQSMSKCIENLSTD